MIFVMALTLSSFTAHRNTYVVIDNVSQVHQNSLAIDSLMERDIRQAGFLVPTRAAACGLDSTNGTDLHGDVSGIRSAHAQTNLRATVLDCQRDRADAKRREMKAYEPACE